MGSLDLDVSLRLGDFGLAVACRIELEGITTIIGPSGSGKTTLLRVIAGLEPEAAGTIVAAGTTWLDDEVFVAPHERQIGYVFQDGALFDHLTVAGNLRFPLRFRTPPRNAVSLDDAISALQLRPLLDRRPLTLSGGERQRVAIARALLASPGLLLMDEPLSSVDHARRQRIGEMIATVPERFGIPILYVTHDHGELVRLGDRALLMTEGRIAAAGSVHAVARQAEFSPATPRRDAASIVEVRVEGHADGLTLLSVDGQTLKTPRLDVHQGSRVRVGIPARDVVLGLGRPTGLSIRNALDATIESMQPLDGGLLDVDLSLGTQSLVARITSDAARDLGLVAGQPVVALIKSVAIDDGRD